MWLRPPDRCRAVLAALRPLVRETTLATRLRYLPPGDRVGPSPPRSLRYNPPARYDAPPGRTSGWPTSAGAATSTLGDDNDGRGAAGSRTIAGGIDEGCGPPPGAHGRDHGLPRAPDRAPRQGSVLRRGAVWQGLSHHVDPF